MGAWGTGPLQSDDALDLVDQFKSSPPTLEVILTTLEDGSVAEMRACIHILMKSKKPALAALLTKPVAELALTKLKESLNDRDAQSWNEPKRFASAVKKQIAQLGERFPELDLTLDPIADVPKLKKIEPPGYGMNWAVLPVKDLAVARSFYRGVIGVVIEAEDKKDFMMLIGVRCQVVEVGDPYAGLIRMKLPFAEREAMLKRLDTVHYRYDLSGKGDRITLIDPSLHHWIISFT